MEVEISKLRANLAASKGEKTIAGELVALRRELDACKAEMAATQAALLERRRDRVLEVALRLMQVAASASAGRDTDLRLKYAESVEAARSLIAEVERQVTP